MHLLFSSCFCKCLAIVLVLVNPSIFPMSKLSLNPPWELGKLWTVNYHNFIPQLSHDEERLKSAREIGFWFLLVILIFLVILKIPLFLFSLVGGRTMSEHLEAKREGSCFFFSFLFPVFIRIWFIIMWENHFQCQDNFNSSQMSIACFSGIFQASGFRLRIWSSVWFSVLAWSFLLFLLQRQTHKEHTK